VRSKKRAARRPRCVIRLQSSLLYAHLVGSIFSKMVGTVQHGHTPHPWTVPGCPMGSPTSLVRLIEAIARRASGQTKLIL
jgi:hypothetical protein